MQLLYIPLDERPCNLHYPQLIARLQPNLSLRVPPPSLLSRKKHPADVAGLWAWLHQNITGCQVALLSMDMLIYGGLLPSRLHHQSLATLLDRLQQLSALKAAHPQLTIFASTLIMRTPAYNSSEEEPDYYAEQGERIFRWGWLQDQQTRIGLTEEEQAQLADIITHLPPADLEDYRQRRAKNLAINQATIDLVEQDVIRFLAIPQDDSALYGFTALDQQQVVRKIIDLRLQARVHLYPGADEVGCTLLARAYHHLRGTRTTVALLYSSVMGEQIVPLYEDRPLGESVKAHLLAAGAQWSPQLYTADCVLALNSPGQQMQEAWDQPTKDITYTSYRNLRFFVDQIQQLLGANIPVALADVAFANGGETELVQLLDDGAAWDAVLAYGGWNTSCNTMGTVLATAILGLGGQPGKSGAWRRAIAINKIHHLLEDWAYQSIVRMQMVTDYLPTVGASYYDFNGQATTINQEMARRMLTLWSQVMQQSFRDYPIAALQVFSPWQRMFEIGLQFDLSGVHDEP